MLIEGQYFPVDLMDLLFNQEQKFYNSTLADLETSYHLLTSIYYKNSLNLTMSLVTKYYPYQPQKLEGNLLLWTGHKYE
jgi:hypothetical protein